MAAEVDYHGVCIVKADASDLIRPYDTSVSRTPEISSVAMTSTVQLPLSDSDVASIGGAPCGVPSANAGVTLSLFRGRLILIFCFCRGSPTHEIAPDAPAPDRGSEPISAALAQTMQELPLPARSRSW